MPRVSPFTGLVFDPDVTGPLEVVTAPPYDVIGEAERRAFLSSSPYSVVHLDLSEADGGRDRYERAAELLATWRREGALVQSAEPGYVAYEMRFRLEARERTIRGLLCALQLEDWGGAILPHERTMPGPVEDRLRLLRATRANLSAVYGTVTGPVPALASLLDEVTAGRAVSLDGRRGGGVAPHVAGAGRSGHRGMARERAPADRRRAPPLHDGPAVPGRTPRRRRAVASGTRSSRSSSTPAPRNRRCCRSTAWWGRAGRRGRPS